MRSILTPAFLVFACLAPSATAAQTVQPVEVLHTFALPPMRPDGPLLQVPDGSLYGVMSNAIYRVATDGTVSIAARLEDGIGASGALARDQDGRLYGTTQWGGAAGRGTIYRFDPASGAVVVLHEFTARHEGSAPSFGLTLHNGVLYGVGGALFRADPVTGATTILASFPSFPSPSSPLTLGADGYLYWTTATGPGPIEGTWGAIYRLDPATDAVTVVHAFTNLSGPAGRLTLGAGGWLYGSTKGIGLGGTVGGVYRFAPATGTLEVLHTFPSSGTYPARSPSPIAIAADGALYGVTRVVDGAVPQAPSTIFRLVPGPSGYTYEALAQRTFGVDVALTVATDGSIYGYAAETDGFSPKFGAVYRFQPGATIALEMLSEFTTTSTWAPTEPVFSGNTGYGTTTRPGYGAIYTLNPGTGAVTIPQTIGTAHKFLLTTSQVVTSPLALGPDLQFYATTSATPDSGAPGGGPDTAIVFYQSNGSLMRLLNGTAPASVAFGDDAPMVTAPWADMYVVRGRTVYRFDPDALTLVAAGAGPEPVGLSSRSDNSRLVRSTDGHLYIGFVTFTEISQQPSRYESTARVFRVNPSTDALDLVATLGTGFGLISLAPAPDGELYVAAQWTADGASQVRRLTPSTGAHVQVCASSERGLRHLTAVSDGTIVGALPRWDPAFGLEVSERLLLCNPANGATEIRVLPAAIGVLNGPLVEHLGLLYGATSGVERARATPGSEVPAMPGGSLIRLSLGATALTLDSEADGLPPNRWETQYGLDAFSASGGDGASGDPDGDGRTNAQELADGTHPRGVVTRYFAEGATGPFFSARLSLANPNTGRPASVLLRFLTDSGARITHDVVVDAGDTVSVDVGAIAGLANATFSTIVESDLMIGVDRTMQWDPAGYGSHLETGVIAPATTWHLAEGSTSGAFSLFYLLQNPQPTSVTATVRYLRPLGLPPIDRTYALPPNSRTTIVVDAEGAELASTDVSAVITAPLPIVAERAMYYSTGAQAFAAGHESAGITTPALEWFLAEGATGAFFDLFVLIANPNPSPAVVDVEYLRVGGGTLTKRYTVAGQSRTTIWIDDEQIPADSGTRPFADASLSMTVRSTNDVPIVVERTMWWPGPSLTPDYWQEAHNSPGATTAATRWVVPGAEIGGAAAAQSYVLIANPGDTAGTVCLTRLDLGDRGTTCFAAPAKSRTSVPFLTAPPRGVTARAVGVLVESSGNSPVPVVVEYANYSSPSGVTWAAGGNALAVPLP